MIDAFENLLTINVMFSYIHNITEKHPSSLVF